MAGDARGVHTHFKGLMKFLEDVEVHTLEGMVKLHKIEITSANREHELNSSNLYIVELHQIYDSDGTTQAPDNLPLLELVKS